jgi:hypothetical protein
MASMSLVLRGLATATSIVDTCGNEEGVMLIKVRPWLAGSLLAGGGVWACCSAVGILCAEDCTFEAKETDAGLAFGAKLKTVSASGEC